MGSRPGKYDHLTPRLPKLDGVEPERRDIINAVKSEILAPAKEGEPGSKLDDLTPKELVDGMESNFKQLVPLLKRMTGGRRHASEFVQAYDQMRELKEKLALWQSSTQLLLDAYEGLMVEHLVIEGTKSLRLESGASVSIHDEPSAQVKDREQYRQWCVAQGLERDMHLHPSKTQSLMKEMLMNGEAEPPGVEMYALTKVRWNRA